MGKRKVVGGLRVVFLLVLASLVVYLATSLFVFISLSGLKNNTLQSWFVKSSSTPATNRFSDDADSAAMVSLFIAGDVMLGRTVMMKSYELNDFAYPFRKVADVMREPDIAFVNLENPIIDSCQFQETGLIFCATPEMLGGFEIAGVDVVNLANNHILNYGEEGLNNTLGFIADRNVLATGLGSLATIERKGVVFGFLGFDKSEQVNPKLTQDEIDLISDSDGGVDVLVVSMHWGVEYQDKVLPGVRSLAKETVGYGADLIVGHHPHWVQDWEFVDVEPVFYSLGNFVFDQMWSEQTRKGLAVKLIYDEDGELKDYELLPTYMSSWSQPEFVGK